MNYPISVVVPTKNRYKYLKQLIELVEKFETDELELIIQDNSDNNNEFLEWLSPKNYSWLKYYYCSDKLTSIQNFDKGINNATGDYICFIGDDDGVVRYIVDCAKWMKKNNIEALRCAKTTYHWPEYGKGGGTMYVEKKKQLVEYLNPINELKKILQKGCQVIDNIPVTYVGIVKKIILKEIFKDYGTYFPGGASADISNGVALCFYVKRYVKLNLPILITGASKMTGGVSDRTRPIPLSELSFVAEDVSENWEGDFPKYWLGTVVWPESATKSLRTLHKESFLVYMNHERIIANTIRRAHLCPKDYYQYCSSAFRLRWVLFVMWFSKYSVGIQNRFLRLISGGRRTLNSYRYEGMQDIVEAEKTLSKSININILSLKY